MERMAPIKRKIFILTIMISLDLLDRYWDSGRFFSGFMLRLLLGTASSYFEAVYLLHWTLSNECARETIPVS